MYHCVINNYSIVLSKTININCMEKKLTFAQKAIEAAVAAKTTNSIICNTYTDNGYNDCSGSYYDTDD